MSTAKAAAAAEPKAETITFAREKLSGSLLQLCVLQLEKFDLPWKKVNEKNQKIALNAMGLAIDQAIEEVVAIIATDRLACIPASVDSVMFKDGIKVVLTMDGLTKGRHELADAAGTCVLIAIADAKQYLGGREEVQAQPDQPSLLTGADKKMKEKTAANDWPLKGTGDTKTDKPADGSGAVAEKPDGDTAQEKVGDAKLPEIRRNADNTFTIYDENGAPMAKAKGFPSQIAAEKWLLKEKGIDVKKSREKGTPAADPAKPAGTADAKADPNGHEDDGGGEADADAAAADSPAPPPDIDALVKLFREGAIAAAKGDNPDWDSAWAKICENIPAEVIEEHYAALSGAFADGWDTGLGQ